jgi:hypothetical protein
MTDLSGMLTPYVEAAEEYLQHVTEGERDKQMKLWKGRLAAEGGHPITASLAVRKRLDVSGEAALWLILATNAMLKKNAPRKRKPRKEGRDS